MGIPAVGTVVDALGLKGPSRRIADTASSKTAFRGFLRDNELSCPDFRVCDSFGDAWVFYQAIENKMVLKPDDSSGSRGVKVIDPGESKESVAEAFRKTFEFSRAGRICAEGFLTGTEVGGDAFFVNGEARYFVTTCKHMNGVLVQGHSLPGCLSESDSLRVEKEICLVASRLGYDNGPMNFDVMINENEVAVLEIGLRNGGNGILELIYHCQGIDLPEWLLTYTLGDPMPEQSGFEGREISSYVFGAERSGRLEDISGLMEITATVPEVFEMILAKKTGDHVEKFVHNANLVGYLLLKCGHSEYKSVVSRIREVLRVNVEE